MPAKQLLFDESARHKLLRGIQLLSRAVAVTLGPRGRHVVISQGRGGMIMTKDGVTVAQEIELPDPFENMGVQMVKEVAAKTSRDAGDGTTTATVLAEAIFREGLRSVTAGASPIHLKRGIDKAVTAGVTELARLSRPVRDREEIRQVATISANGDAAIGDLIAEAMDRVGKDGTITVEEAQSMDTSLAVVEGMQFDSGYLSPYLVTAPETMEAVLEDVLVLIHEQKISQLQDLLPLLQTVATAGHPLLIIAADLSGEALTTLVVNKLRGTLRVCAVKAPGYGDQRAAQLEDLAILCGGRCFTADLGERLENIRLDSLGRAKHVTITRDSSLIIQGAGQTDAIQARIRLIRRQIEETTSDHDREALQERLAKLAGGIAVVRVGASTELEMKEKKARVEDALHATRAAVAEGVVAGGGVALLRCRGVVDALKLEGDEAVGAQIVRRALAAPLRALCQNAGVEPGVIIHRVAAGKSDFGYNVVTAEFEDLVKSGVIDPTKVTRAALQNAASIAGLLLTTECMLAEIPATGAVAA